MTSIHSGRYSWNQSCDHVPSKAEEDVVFSKIEDSVELKHGGVVIWGMLQACWEIIKHLANLWYRSWLCDVMYACITIHNMRIEDDWNIIHNMVIENKWNSATNWQNEFSGSTLRVTSETSTQVVPPRYVWRTSQWLPPRRSASMKFRHIYI